MGNPEPFLALPAHQVSFIDRVGENHLRLKLKAGDGATVDAMAFRAYDQPLGQALLAARGKVIHAAGTLMLDHWQGREQVKLRLVDIALTDKL
jgi:single-stranded-DNA-specific exonuclease